MARREELVVQQGAWAHLFARIKPALSTSFAVQADVESIELSVFDLSEDPTDSEIDSETLDVSAVIFDTIQQAGQAGPWGKDSDGYNFRHSYGGEIFEGGHKYRLEYQFTLTGGEPFALVWVVRVEPLYAA